MPIPDDYEIERLREEVKRRPSDVTQQVWLLAALAMKDRLENVETAFRRMYEWKPEWTQLHYDVVTYWGDRMSNVPQLLRTFEAARKRAPKDVVPAYAYALTLQAGARQEEAIAVYEELIAREPRLAVAHHNLGIAHNLFGRREEAARACLRAAELAPSMAEPHFLLGAHYALKKEMGEAVKHTKRFLALAHPYLEQYTFTAETSLALWSGLAKKSGPAEREESGALRRFWNKVRGGPGKR